MRFILCLLTTLAFPALLLAHGMSEQDKTRMLAAGYVEYIWLGAKHMLTGYDHLLFILGVVFYLTRFGDVVKFITAFTLGHCVTLIGATLLQIKADYFLIDAVIALTVIYKAFDNLDGFKKHFNVQPPGLLGMVFAFGLIHGFGLSTRLQQLPLGDDSTELVVRILSFNVGVELGQVIALGVMVVLLSSWRKYDSFTTFARAGNVLLMIVGTFLLLMQLHGYQHTAYPDEFPLNKDDHYHTYKLIDAK
jgi:hypothetical protein